ncbi:transcription termination factor MTERF2, chloroplastic [Musa acuminata AAA Group]|uniref:transcription termination factor MTERF2, chloroplastic n=1 Tax=Musa acuminata AAA Group TaxID=214697 RepID=UPI0031DBE021
MMLCHGHRHQPTVLVPSLLPPNPNTVLPVCGTLFSRKPLLLSSLRAALDSKHHLQPLGPDAETDPPSLSRRQNALLLDRSHSHPIDGPPIDEEEREDELTRKKVVEEYSLATRRVPRFPGSVDFPRAGALDLPPPDLRRVFDGDDRSLKRALEVRRGVAAETLKDALRAGKMSINYTTNLVSRLTEFVDRVVIGAATLKAVPEFAHMSFNARAKSYIQRSCVVSLVKWLKHNHMAYPQIAKVICMCPGDLQLVRRIAEWLKSIHVKGESIGVVLVKAGPLFEHSLDELEEIVNYLENNGVRKDWMGFVVSRCPQVLGLTMEELESRVKFYLDMGMNEKDFGTMVFDYPRALGFFSLEEMANKVQYLKEFGLSTEDVGRLLAFKPQLMGCSIEERWRPLVKYLYYLGVQRDGMKRILIVKPMVFCIDLETTIAPKVRFLQDIGVRTEAIGGVLVKFPSFLTYSLYKKIRPVVVFLMTKAGVTQRDIGKVIALDPQLVGCSITKKLDISVKYFLSLGIHLQSLGEMIADFPMLLRYNIDILRPKYRYLRRVMVRPLQDLIEFPRFFSYSLDERIIPRHKILVANRVNFKLRYMLSGSDEEFNQRVQFAIEKRKRFESGYANLDASDDESTHVVPVASS